IRQLKMENNYFSKLSDSYEDIVKELHRIETQIETPEDIYVEELKKKRLFLKDEIYAMLTS
ncbi:MAG: YdcH family protein, partial [Gammaproteobacteria bacterium]|nr:YdcH family protein [Gammaproteobacteria bacterium]